MSPCGDERHASASARRRASLRRESDARDAVQRDPLAREVEPDDEQRQRQAGKMTEARARLHERQAGDEHLAPLGRRRLHAEAEEAERRDRDDDEARVRGGVHEHRAERGGDRGACAGSSVRRAPISCTASMYGRRLIETISVRLSRAYAGQAASISASTMLRARPGP